MRTAIKKTDVYTFDELSESAKQTAIDEYRSEGLDYEWWEFAYDDAIDIAALMGIEIDNIFFSGFSSQGDGACFEGSYEYKKGSVKAIRQHAPKDTELHQIAYDLYEVQRKNFYQLSANVKQSGHYMHEMCTSITVYKNDDYGSYHADVDTDNSVCEALRDFMMWIYKNLENEYDYINSDEVITDIFINNSWEFSEDGSYYI